MEPVNTSDSPNHDINPRLLKYLDRILDKLAIFEDVTSRDFHQTLSELETLFDPLKTEKRDRESLADHVVSTFDLNAIISRVWSGILHQSDNDSEGSDIEKGESDDGNSEVSYVSHSCSILLRCLMTFTDASENMCVYLGDTGVLEVLLQGIEHGNLTEDIIQLVAGIVNNCCWLVPGNRVLCQGYISVLQDLTESTNRRMQTIAFLALSYIVDESDHHKLALSKSCVTFLLDVLSEALDNPSRTSPSTLYSALEVIQGIHQLSVNDHNKNLIVDVGGIAVLERVILDPSSSDREKEFAAKAIWQLGFIDQHKALIRERSALIEHLKLLKETSGCQDLQKACSGALFVVSDIDKSRREQLDSQKGTPIKSGPGEDKAHIMISYQHSNQATMIRVKKYLERNGYNVWMDVDKIEGDILEAMARAVQKAAVVLVCMSQQYKDSQFCRSEATYAFLLKKEIIPLKLQEGYKPDDWLGALIGMNLYYPMYSQEHMGTTLPRLIVHLGEKGKLEPPVASSRVRKVRDTTDEPDSKKSRVELRVRQQPRDKPLHSHDVESWGQDEVRDWLKFIGLDVAGSSNLQTLSGTRISQIRNLMDRAPEYCLKALEKEYGLSFGDVLSFVSALESL